MPPSQSGTRTHHVAPPSLALLARTEPPKKGTPGLREFRRRSNKETPSVKTADRLGHLWGHGLHVDDFLENSQLGRGLFLVALLPKSRSLPLQHA